MSDNIVPNALLAFTNLSATFVDNHWTVTYDDWSPNTAKQHIQGLISVLKEDQQLSFQDNLLRFVEH